jgi:hypothetical protein
MNKLKTSSNIRQKTKPVPQKIHALSVRRLNRCAKEKMEKMAEFKPKTALFS